jgi:hypothetical protein
MRTAGCLAALAAWPTAGLALEPGASAFRYVSELVEGGFAPFATSGAGNATFGMTNGLELYMCFIADTGTAQAERQSVLVEELAGGTTDRTVPNIPVICILTQ